MKFINTVIKIFWNRDEKRLRAFWRVAIHSSLTIFLVSFFTVAIFLVFLIFDLIGGTSIQELLTATDPMQIMQTSWIGTVLLPLATFMGLTLATIATGKWIDRRKVMEFGIVFSKEWWLDFGFGLGLGAFLMGLVFLFGRAIGYIGVTGYFFSFSQEAGFLAGFFQSIILFVFVGIYEEILSRGYHLINLAEGLNHKFIGSRWALILALLISSLVFGLLHMSNPNASWISTLNISLAGIFLGLGMVLTGSLAIPIGLHITWNLFQGNVFGFPVSGISTGSTLIATETSGPAWLMGGAFGPEAGVVGLAAMLIGSALTLLWVHRKARLALREALAIYSKEDKSVINDNSNSTHLVEY